MRSKWLFLAIAALAAAPGASSAQGEPQISQRGRAFDPDHVAMREGETLRILNDDRFVHHIYSQTPGLKFDSGPQRPGETISIEFDKVGVYEFRCAIHPKMHLEVDVEKAGAEGQSSEAASPSP